MNNVYQYTTQDERIRILNENETRYLIEERNIVDGDFLVFADEPPTPPTVLITVPQKEFETMKRAIDDLILGGAF